jgi:hypothetical protein
MYRETGLYFESEELPGESCALRYKVKHLHIKFATFGIAGEN